MTYEDAEEDAVWFRISKEFNIQFQSNISRYEQNFIDLADQFSDGCFDHKSPCVSEGMTLNSAQKSEYKYLASFSPSGFDRIAYKESKLWSVQSQERMKRAIVRGSIKRRGWRSTKCGRACYKKRKYLNNRVSDLEIEIETLTEVTIGLQQALIQGKACEYIIFPTPDRFDVDSSDPPPLGDGENTFLNNSPENFTACQMSRAVSQCYIMLELVRLKVQTKKEEVALIEKVLVADTGKNDDDDSNHAVSLRQFNLQEWRSNNSTPLMIDSILERFKSDDLNYSGETYLRWWNSFKKSGYKGFQLDGRGNSKRDFFLEEYNVVNSFKLFMKTHKKLSVKACCKYLSDYIISKPEIYQNLESFHLKLPLNTTTVHRWMLRCGASYRKGKQTYYTDNHDTPENINYRNNVYIPKLTELSKRLPEWISVPYEHAQSDQLYLLYTWRIGNSNGY